MKIILALLLIVAFISPAQAFAQNSDGYNNSNPGIFVTAVNSNRVDLVQSNVSENATLYLETANSNLKNHKLGKLKMGKETQSFKLPDSTRALGGMYVIVARDDMGSFLAQSQFIQVGGFAKDAPDCNILSTKVKVAPAEKFTISWKSPKAKSVYKNVGFSDEPQRSLRKNSKMTLNSSIPGIRQYTLVFGSDSGSQSACTVFIEVVSDSDQSTKGDLTIDVLPLDTKSLRPLLTGTAPGAKSVRVSVTSPDEKVDGFMWISKSVKVNNDKWSVRVAKLPRRNAEYVVEVYIYDNGQYGSSERATLAVQ